MLLFGGQLLRPQKEPLSRPEKFRRQIRQTSLQERFESIRAALIVDLRSDRLYELLHQHEGGFGEEQLRESIQLFGNDYKTSEWTDKMAGSRLQSILADTLIKNEGKISLDEASIVVSVLASLTYFSRRAVEGLIGKDEFIDHLRRRMERLQMQTEEELRFFNQGLSLLLNLTCETGSDFCFFCAESDLSLVITRQLAKTIVHGRDRGRSDYFRELVIQGREYGLRVFKNIVQGLTGEGEQQAGEVAARLASSVLCDEENMEHYPALTFLLVAQGLECSRFFWSSLMGHPDHTNFVAQLCQAMDILQDRCFQPAFLNQPQNILTTAERDSFYGMVCFLTQLFYEKDPEETSFEICIENVLNGYMLAQFILQGEEDNREHFLAGIKLVWQISMMVDVTADQLMIVRPADDPLTLLRVIMNGELLKEPVGGYMCMMILQVILRRDPSYLPKLVQLQIFDKLLSVFDNCTQSIHSKKLHLESIELAAELLRAAKALGDEARIFGIMEQRGIVADVRQMTNHNDKEIYVKAEMFMEVVAEIERLR